MLDAPPLLEVLVFAPSIPRSESKRAAAPHVAWGHEEHEAGGATLASRGSARSESFACAAWQAAHVTRMW